MCGCRNDIWERFIRKEFQGEGVGREGGSDLIRRRRKGGGQEGRRGRNIKLDLLNYY